jgi:hypothetical protein
MLLAERIKAISDIPSKERTRDEKKELRKLNDLRRKGSKNPARLAFDKQKIKKYVAKSRLHKTEFPIKVTWSDGKDPEDLPLPNSSKDVSSSGSLYRSVILLL